MALSRVCNNPKTHIHHVLWHTCEDIYIRSCHLQMSNSWTKLQTQFMTKPRNSTAKMLPGCLVGFKLHQVNRLETEVKTCCVWLCHSASVTHLFRLIRSQPFRASGLHSRGVWKWWTSTYQVHNYTGLKREGMGWWTKIHRFAFYICQLQHFCVLPNSGCGEKMRE